MRSRGFSLIETVLGMAILALVLMAALALLPLSLQSMRGSEHQLAANTWAQEIIDQCAAGPFESLIPGTHNASNSRPLSPILQTRTLEDNVVLQAEVEIQPGPGDTSGRLRCLDVIITWKEKQQDKKLVRHRRISHLRR